jgi:hypothetical protein
MGARHILQYHVGIPVAVFLVAIVVGVPIGTAFAIGMMTGCMSMMVMMIAGMHAHARRNDSTRHDVGSNSP